MNLPQTIFNVSSLNATLMIITYEILKESFRSASQIHVLIT